MTVVLDAWAVIAYLRDEPPAGRVEDAIAAGSVMSWINLGEVLYILHRHEGSQEARETVRDLRGRINVELPSEKRIVAAAEIKGAHPLSYADAFAAATALAHGSPLLTGDPELLGATATWLVEDLR